MKKKKFVQGKSLSAWAGDYINNKFKCSIKREKRPNDRSGLSAGSHGGGGGGLGKKHAPGAG